MKRQQGCSFLIRAGAALALLTLPAAACAQKPTGSAPAAATVATHHFTSDPSVLPADWRVHYTPISFDYPADWRLTDPGDTGFLVNASRPVPNRPEGEVSEIFAAFPFAANETTLPSVIEQSLDQYAAWMRQAWGFPGQARSDFTISGTSYPGLVFEGASDEDETVWGRLVIVPLAREGDQVKGVGIVMVGSTLAPEIGGAADVGTRGGLATILTSLRGGMGTPAAAPPATAATAPPAQAAGAANDAGGGGLKVGEYACYGSGGTVLIGLGFKVVAPGRTTDLDGGNAGTYVVQGDQVMFHGGHLDGQVGRNLNGGSFQIGAMASCEPW